MAERRDMVALPDFFSDSSFWTPEWRHVCSRSHEHAPFLFWLLDVLRPRHALEVGTRWGVSYLALCQGMKRLGVGGTCRSVSSHEGEPEAGFDECHRTKYGDFSAWERTASGAEFVPSADGRVDLLMIDGECDGGCLGMAPESWSAMMSERGVVLCFGILRPGAAGSLWKKWAKMHPHAEFPHGGGLGVLGIGREIPGVINALLSMPEGAPDARLIRQLYAGLGEKLSAEADLRREQARCQQWLRDGARSLQQQGLETKDAISRMGLEVSAAKGALRMEEWRVKEIEAAFEKERAKAATERGILESRVESLRGELQVAQSANRDLAEECRKFQAALDEVEMWQRSWLRRTFTRWHRTRSDSHPPLLTRWVRSLKKRCFSRP